jgi:hypothetical protein
LDGGNPDIRQIKWEENFCNKKAGANLIWGVPSAEEGCRLFVVTSEVRAMHQYQQQQLKQQDDPIRTDLNVAEPYVQVIGPPASCLRQSNFTNLHFNCYNCTPVVWRCIQSGMARLDGQTWQAPEGIAVLSVLELDFLDEFVYMCFVIDYVSTVGPT